MPFRLALPELSIVAWTFALGVHLAKTRAQDCPIGFRYRGSDTCAESPGCYSFTWGLGAKIKPSTARQYCNEELHSDAKLLYYNNFRSESMKCGSYAEEPIWYLRRVVSVMMRQVLDSSSGIMGSQAEEAPNRYDPPSTITLSGSKSRLSVFSDKKSKMTADMWFPTDPLRVITGYVFRATDCDLFRNPPVNTFHSRWSVQEPHQKCGGDLSPKSCEDGFTGIRREKDVKGKDTRSKLCKGVVPAEYSGDAPLRCFVYDHNGQAFAGDNPYWWYADPFAFHIGPFENGPEPGGIRSYGGKYGEVLTTVEKLTQCLNSRLLAQLYTGWNQLKKTGEHYYAVQLFGSFFDGIDEYAKSTQDPEATYSRSVPTSDYPRTKICSAATFARPALGSGVNCTFNDWALTFKAPIRKLNKQDNYYVPGASALRQSTVFPADEGIPWAGVGCRINPSDPRGVPYNEAPPSGVASTCPDMELHEPKFKRFVKGDSCIYVAGFGRYSTDGSTSPPTWTEAYKTCQSLLGMTYVHWPQPRSADELKYLKSIMAHYNLVAMPLGIDRYLPRAATSEVSANDWAYTESWGTLPVTSELWEKGKKTGGPSEKTDDEGRAQGINVCAGLIRKSFLHKNHVQLDSEQEDMDALTFTNIYAPADNRPEISTCIKRIGNTDANVFTTYGGVVCERRLDDCRVVTDYCDAILHSACIIETGFCACQKAQGWYEDPDTELSNKKSKQCYYKPPKPILTAAPDVFTVDLKWTLPTSAEQPVLTADSYVLFQTPSGVVTGKEMSGTSARVQDLKKGTSYLFKVVARNKKAGADSETAEITVTTLATPSGLGQPKVTECKEPNAKIVWPEPSDPGIPKELTYIVSRHRLPDDGQPEKSNPVSTKAYTWPGMVGGETYQFRYIAKNDAGESDESDPSEPCTPVIIEEKPLPPADLTVTGISSTSAVVSWKAPAVTKKTSIRGYFLHYRPKGAAWIVEDLTQGELSYRLSQLQSKTSYEVKMTAYNGAGNSSESKTKFDTVSPTAPSVPRNLQAKPNGLDRVDLTWNPPQEPGDPRRTKYTVEKVVAGRSNWAPVANCPDRDRTSCADVNVPRGTYDYRVTAWNGVKSPEAKTAKSIFVEGQPESPDKPFKPRAVVVTGNTARIEWDSPSGENAKPVDSYNILLSKKTENKFQSVEATLLTSLEIPAYELKDPGRLLPGMEYQVRVEALYKGKKSEQSEPSDVFQLKEPPSAPEQPKAKCGPGAADVTWMPPKSNGRDILLGYYVYKRDVTAKESVFTKAMDSLIKDATTVKIPNLINEHDYLFTVAAVNSVETGPQSDPSEKCTPVPENTEPLPPGKPKVTPISDEKATVTWTPAKDNSWQPVRGYNVWLRQKTTETWTQLTTARIQDTVYPLTDLKHGLEYQVKITAENEFGKKSTDSPFSDYFQTLLKQTVPDRPKKLTAEEIPKKNEVKLSWDKPFDGNNPITGYVIQRKLVTETVWGSDIPVPGLDTNVVATSVSDGIYDFRISSMNGIGNSADWASTKLQVWGADKAPNKPTKPMVKTNYEIADVTWDMPQPAQDRPVKDYYVVYKISDGSGEEPRVFADNPRYQTLRGLTPGKQYVAQILAKNDVAETLSEWSDPFQLDETVPNPPVNLKVVGQPVANNVQLVWEDGPFNGNSLITNYRIKITSKTGALPDKLLGESKSLTIDDIAKGTYSFTVEAKNIHGFSDASKLLTVEVKSSWTTPATPSKPVILDITSKTATAAWEMPEGAKSSAAQRYHVFVEAPGIEGRKATNSPTTEKSLVLEDLIPDKVYRVWVQAENEFTSPDSPKSEPFQLRGAPNPPVIVEVKNIASTKVKVTWQAPTYASHKPVGGYDIYLRTETVQRWKVTETPLTNDTLDYELDKLTPESVYWVMISAINPDFTTDSVEKKFQTKSSKPGAPKNFAAPSPRPLEQVVLTWLKPVETGDVDAECYDIQKRKAGENWDPPETMCNQSKALTKVLNVAWGTYDFRARTINKNDVASSWATLNNVKVDFKARPPVNAPNTFTVTETLKDVTINWATPAYTIDKPITGYTVTLLEAGHQTGSWKTNDNSFTFKKLTAGVQYQAQVSSSNLQGDGPPGENSRPFKLTERVPDPVVLYKAVNLVAEDVRISLVPPKFDGNSKITGYTVSWKPLDGKGSPGATTIKTTDFTITQITKKGIYEFNFTASNIHGESVPLRVPLEIASKFNRPHAPERPIVDIGSITETQASVSWPKSKDDTSAPVDDYYVYVKERRKGVSEPVTIGTTRIPATGKLNLILDAQYGLEQKKDYVVQVTASNEAGQSSFSSPSLPFRLKEQMEQPERPTLHPPSSITATGAQLNWKPGSTTDKTYAEGFKILIESKGDTTRDPVVISGNKTLSYALTKLRSNTAYNISVQATNKAGGSAFDSRIFMTYPTAPGEPRSVKAVPQSAERVRVTWTEPEWAGEPRLTGYRIQSRKFGEKAWNSWNMDGETTDHEWTDGSVPQGRYEYRVLAYNENSEVSKWANAEEISVESKYVRPNKPNILAIDPKIADSVKVSWAAPPPSGLSPVTYYVVRWENTAGGISGKDNVTGCGSAKITNPTCDHTIKNIALGMYNFSVTAGNQHSESDKATELNVKVASKYKKPERPHKPDVSERTETNALASWKVPDPPKNSPEIWYSVTVRKLGERTANMTYLAKQTKRTLDGLVQKQQYVVVVKAVNEAGESLDSDESDAFDLITTNTDPPDPPPYLHIDIKDIKAENVTLHWTKPDIEGGAPVDRYIITKKLTEAKEWGKGNETKSLHYVVTGLAQRTMYDFAVSACNKYGCGKPTATYGIETVGKPSKPPPPTVEKCGEADARIKYGASGDDGGDGDIYYRIYCINTAQPTTEIKSPELKITPESKYVFGNLEVEKTYRFYVTARNMAGESQRSDASDECTTEREDPFQRRCESDNQCPQVGCPECVQLVCPPADGTRYCVCPTGLKAFEKHCIVLETASTTDDQLQKYINQSYTPLSHCLRFSSDFSTNCCMVCYPLIEVDSCHCVANDKIHFGMPKCDCLMMSPRKVACLELNRECRADPCPFGKVFDRDVGHCTDLNECQFPEFNDCDMVHGTCVNKPWLYECVCDKGYGIAALTGDRQRCVDIDECEQNKTICGFRHICTNIDGSYHCNCPPNTHFVDGTCRATPECRAFPQICTNRGAYCVDYGVSSHYECQCKRTFYLNEKGYCEVGSQVIEFKLHSSEMYNNNYQEENSAEFQHLADVTAKWIEREVDMVPSSILAGKYHVQVKRFEKDPVRETVIVYVTLVHQPDPHLKELTLNFDAIANYFVKEKIGSFCDTAAAKQAGNHRGVCSLYKDDSGRVLRINSVSTAKDPGLGLLNPCSRKDDHDCDLQRSVCTHNSSSTEPENGYTFTCDCRPGFDTVTRIGHKSFCVDANECKAFRFPCLPGPKVARCINTFGSFYCDCPEAYYFANATSCVKKDACLMATDRCGQASFRGRCISREYPRFDCICNAGYAYNATTEECEDIDECLDPLNQRYCSEAESAFCVNTEGHQSSKPQCACRSGFYRDSETNRCRISAYAYNLTIPFANEWIGELRNNQSRLFDRYAGDVSAVFKSVFEAINDGGEPPRGESTLETVRPVGRDFMTASVIAKVQKVFAPNQSRSKRAAVAGLSMDAWNAFTKSFVSADVADISAYGDDFVGLNVVIKMQYMHMPELMLQVIPDPEIFDTTKPTAPSSSRYPRRNTTVTTAVSNTTTTTASTRKPSETNVTGRTASPPSQSTPAPSHTTSPYADSTATAGSFDPTGETRPSEKSSALSGSTVTPSIASSSEETATDTKKPTSSTSTSRPSSTSAKLATTSAVHRTTTTTTHPASATQPSGPSSTTVHFSTTAGTAPTVLTSLHSQASDDTSSDLSSTATPPLRPVQ